MERARRVRLDEVMAAVARRDGEALGWLWREFGDVLGRRMVAIARERGHHYVPRHAVGDLVTDACLVLFDVAPSWRPEGGALPWVWARGRLGACVDRVLGPPMLPFPDGERWAPPPPEHAPVAYQGDEPPARVALLALAEGDGTCRLLLDALDRVLSRVDQEVFLRYVDAQASGDPSPAFTIAARFGLRPATVRQRASRARRRLRSLAERDPRFGALAGLALITPPPSRRSDAAPRRPTERQTDQTAAA